MRPSVFLAPGLPENVSVQNVLALISAAGLTYQAQVFANMSPGDTVIFLGDVGPGSLPLRVLLASGLKPIWITDDPSVELPDGVESRSAIPSPEELPTLRCHMIDLEPSQRSLAKWLPFVSSCISGTLLGPEMEIQVSLRELLKGQICLRWFCDLHPHLILDLAALVFSGQIDPSAWVDCIEPSRFPEAYASFCTEKSTRWPVLTWSCESGS